jgi:CheY-like chemotaxis protein
MNVQTAATKSPLACLRVLVVDDQRTMRAILRDLLHQCGIGSVTGATDGEDALHQLELLTTKDEAPDVILCDLHMEKMDGMELVAHLRRGRDASTDKRIPIILLTGESDEMMLEVVQQVGVSEILKKPVSAEELGKAIERAVGVSGS